MICCEAWITDTYVKHTQSTETKKTGAQSSSVIATASLGEGGARIQVSELKPLNTASATRGPHSLCPAFPKGALSALPRVPPRALPAAGAWSGSGLDTATQHSLAPLETVSRRIPGAPQNSSMVKEAQEST